MADDTLLCGKRGDPSPVTVKTYLDWEKERDHGNTINATRFHSELGHAIFDYAGILRNPPLGTKWRSNFDKKMQAVLRNCG